MTFFTVENKSVPSTAKKENVVKRTLLAAGIVLYLAALFFMHDSVPSLVQRETVCIEGPGGKPCLGTVWRPESPKAVILIGHGVSANQSVMTTSAKAFANNGYIAVTFDFWGHGRSRERFDWTSNPGQIHAWVAWAREQFKGFPLAYMGHSMGGFSGAEAFVQDPDGVDAFVAMGALPRQFPTCKTLVALGRFEELFSIKEARQQAQSKAEVAASPFSDHALETWDPLLIHRIISWVNNALGFNQPGVFPWGRWMLSMLAVVLGCVTALFLAETITSWLRSAAAPRPSSPPPAPTRRWSINVYRLAGRLFGIKGNGVPPRSGTFLLACLQGILFSLSFALLLSWVLDGHMFTSNLNHPARCVMWLLLALFMTPFFLLDASALERLPLSGAWTRFAVAALTWCVPLLILGAVLRMLSPGLAFGGMMLGIVAFLCVILAAIHALATRATGDYRAGAIANGILFAWVIAFWFPLVWG